jgi:hypothetical protein
MQSLFDMIFGTANTTNNLTSPATQQAANTAFNQAYAQYQAGAIAGANAGLGQQMAAQQYNNLLGRPTHGYAAQQALISNWVFNGRACRDAREFADLMWPEDCSEKTFFILKHAGKDTE